ncbi:hypothetical protein LAT59_02695 [Candidatus Gracilibacteria bacterium]|nr:hypothetical protein [Candidatus Gracilibacteria bacterium]
MTNFGDLINIEEFGDKRLYFSEERGEVTFYCKDCKDIVEVERPQAGGYTFICKVCGGKNIAIGTKQGLIEMYKLKK